MDGRRIGVFGGSFDPVHLGHLMAAQDAAEQMELDRVFFMPSSRSPLKERTAGASDAQRLELLHAALADDPRFEISTLEIERGGFSYTVDTARALRDRHPEDQVFWIIGADWARRLVDWREIETLAAMVEFIVLPRPGYSLPKAKLPHGIKLHPVESHMFEISSSEIRERIAVGKPVRYFLPAPVADLIERGGPFYRNIQT